MTCYHDPVQISITCYHVMNFCSTQQSNNHSAVACGATLYQNKRGKVRLVGYKSKKLPAAEIRYTIHELEL